MPVISDNFSINDGSVTLDFANWSPTITTGSKMKTKYCRKCGQKMLVNDKTRVRYNEDTGNPVRRGTYEYRCPTGKKGHKRIVVTAS